MRKENNNFSNNILPEKVIKNRKTKLLEKSDMHFFYIKFLVVIVIVAIVLNFIYGVTFIWGQDMYPAIKDGDVVIYFRLNFDYQIGDVISFKINKTEYISRIVAQEGDVVDITEAGELVINGNVQQEDIYFSTYQDVSSGITFPYTVSEGAVFVLGDFRTGATDSRMFGQVSIEDINGTIFTVLRRRGI